MVAFVQEMVMVHRVFRRELRLLPPLIRRVRPNDAVRLAVLADAVDDLLLGLHVHHTGEDELLWPTLLSRVPLEKALISRMHGQHEQVAVHVEAATKLLTQWRGTGDAADGGRLADALDDLAIALGEHLTEEEQHILPLAERHLTEREWAMLGQHGLAAMGRARALMTLGAILEDATPRERAQFLHTVPRPARIAWYLVGRRRYREAMRRRRDVA
jgi:hemerythrin-like domain-containing protein